MNEELKNQKKSPYAEKEESVLSEWKEKGIFQKTLLKDAPKGDFVFFEGPPTANGRPGIHHLEARAFKDLIPRYKTMQGYRVRRKAGWDTHGLPVELEVEKKLGLTSKKDIEHYGIEAFNAECKKSVWTYVDEWKDFTNRMGYWVDLDDPYITYKAEYIESLWSIVKKVHNEKLLYKDYKVVPWCPRCGTGLSSHELAQGYADVKDLSVYAKFKVVGRSNTYILAWTTTPWTLPGNVALAVGNDIEYVEVLVGEETYILAKAKLSLLEDKGVITKEYTGAQLLGLEYEPLYPYLKESISGSEKEKLSNAWKVYSAHFVTTDDGTGVVHTAVMYGQDDFVLGTQLQLPKFHCVDETGHFYPFVTQFAGRFVKDEEVAVDIIKDLAHRGLLFKKEKYEHSYPFCWRCKTPLIYYARDSWYIQMSSLRDTLIKENNGIHWEPEHIQKGRFGEWLSDVKDWAISRERYWGTPLPVWMNGEGDVHVVGSVEELVSRTKNNGNTFVFIRHGGSEHNEKSICSSTVSDPYHLTEKGKSEVSRIAEDFRNKTISTIYTSPFIRTEETAEILRSALGIDSSRVVRDERIQEFNFGDFNGKSFEEYVRFRDSSMTAFETPVPNGESFLDAKRRFGDFLYDIDQKHKGETILVVTHGIGLEVIQTVIEGADALRSKELVRNSHFEPASVLEYRFTPLPHNKDYEIDLHRPFIDEVVLLDEKGGEMKRVKEVMDVWFDSGGMPFAQDAVRVGTPEEKTMHYPADFISEAIDQTRGWFYTLHAIGALTGKGKAYKNVICLGHILDKDGQKMSKSRGNTINPWDMIETYGVDPLRFWMYTVNQPGESKNFDERTVDDVVKKVFNLLSNVTQFYGMYTAQSTRDPNESAHVLDQWVIARVAMCRDVVTDSLDAYRPLEGGRAIRDCIADVSQWYVRRSRDRIKEDGEDKDFALATLGFVIREIAKLLAPFTPMFAEDMYKKAGGERESVHLEEWPQSRRVDTTLIETMDHVRDLVSKALLLRAEAGIKIRQPLQRLSIESNRIQDNDGYTAIIADEVNVKEIQILEHVPNGMVLDTEITPALQQEGYARDVIRAIQEARKKEGKIPSEMVAVTISVSSEYVSAIETHQKEIQETCSISHMSVSEMGHGEEISISFT